MFALPSRRASITVAVLTIVVGAYVAHLLWGRGRDGLDGLFDDWVQSGLLLSGAALARAGAW